MTVVTLLLTVVTLLLTVVTVRHQNPFSGSKVTVMLLKRRGGFGLLVELYREGSALHLQPAQQACL